jgi:hypothetical protein
MTLVAAPSDLHGAVSRIDNWLLRSGIQIHGRAQRGGIAGSLDPDGRPQVVNLETVGYYLTAAAWLSSGAASFPRDRKTLESRAGRTADWVSTLLARKVDPPSRLYLSGQPADWRNGAVFSFDLAMAARGMAATMQPRDRRGRRRALSALCARIDRISFGADIMASHEFVRDGTTMPEHWSTRPGPHHLKAAAAILRLPDRIAGAALIGLAQETCEYWMYALRSNTWPCQEVHPLLYGIEGMLILSGNRDGQGLQIVERLFVRLMEDAQASDGTLSENIDCGIVRSDVLAQALRVGLLLRGRGHLTGSMWEDRLDRLADALLGFVRPDGGVLFSRNEATANTRCALFALQALDLSARKDTCEPTPTAAFQLLV